MLEANVNEKSMANTTKDNKDFSKYISNKMHSNSSISTVID